MGKQTAACCVVLALWLGGSGTALAKKGEPAPPPFQVEEIRIPHVAEVRSGFAEDLNLVCAEAAKIVGRRDVRALLEERKANGKDNSALTFRWSKIQEELGKYLRSDDLTRWENAKLIGGMAAINNACSALADPRLALTDKYIETLREVWKSASSMRVVLKGGLVEKALNRKPATDSPTPELVEAINAAESDPKPSKEALQPSTPSGSLEERIVAGLANFLADRAKAEAALFFREHMATKLCKPEDARTDNATKDQYLPSLCAGLRNIDGTLSLQSMSVFLREAARSDLVQMPNVMLADAAHRASAKARGDHTDTAQKTRLRRLAEGAHAARVVYSAHREARGPRDGVDILRGLSELPYLACESAQECNQLVPVMRSIGMIYRSLETYQLLGDHPAWSDAETKYALIGTAFEIERLSTRVMDPSGKPVPGPLANLNAHDATGLIDLLSDLRVTLRDLKDRARKLNEESRNATGDTASKAETRMRLRVEMLEQVTLALEQGLRRIARTQGLITDPDGFRDSLAALDRVRDALRMGQAVLEADYGRIGVAAIAVVGVVKAAAPEELKLPEGVISMLPVVAELASAETSQDVQGVLEAAAAPAGSYRQKRERAMMSISALAGFGWGKERYRSQTSGGGTGEIASAFLPLGLHLTTPSVANQYAGAFISVFDFGPLAANRNEDTVTEQSGIGFRELFSPGVYLTHSVWESVTLGAGTAMSPELLTNTSTGEKVDAWRWQIFVAFDLTLFPL